LFFPKAGRESLGEWLQDAYVMHEDLRRCKSTLDTKIAMVTFVMVTGVSMVLILWYYCCLGRGVTIWGWRVVQLPPSGRV
jgi:hypothetical protein